MPQNTRNATFARFWLLAISICMPVVADPGIASSEQNCIPEKGLASWYGERHRGKLMANGKPFDPDRMTGASWFYSFGTRVKVTSLEEEDRSVVVTITDRGPSQDLLDRGRIIDLGEAAFSKLAPTERGLIPVRVEVFSEKPEADEDRVEPDCKKGAPTGCAQNTHG